MTVVCKSTVMHIDVDAVDRIWAGIMETSGTLCSQNADSASMNVDTVILERHDTPSSIHVKTLKASR
jgi:hypothetical protein